MPKPHIETTDEHGRVVNASSDGACSGNPGPGGWGALIRFENGSIHEFGGYEPATTNNRMELQAVLEIFEYLKDRSLHPHMAIRTDSKYVINGLSNWMESWKSNGWRTSSGKPVLNQDLWKALDRARLNVKLEYVKGHSGDIDNERVDHIAVSYSKGTYIKLTSEPTSSPKKMASKAISNESTKLTKPGPQKLQRLLSRLDIANHLAKQGYSLNIVELSELLETPTNKLKVKTSSWQWRDWLVEPVGDDKWRLRALEEELNCYEEEKDG